jgi:hypothetical protein
LSNSLINLLVFYQAKVEVLETANIQHVKVWQI